MTHLTDDQLSALFEGTLPASERAACDAHLATCDACRARLADVSKIDASLRGALEYDPGEAYFESFADRVAARIAAAPRGTVHRPAGAKPPFWRWLLSPSGLALVGSTAALIAVAGIAWMRFQGHDDAGRALQEAVREAPPPHAPALEVAPEAGAPSRSDAPPSPERANEAAPGTVSPPASETRARRVERLASGEEVPVTTRQELAKQAPSPTATSGVAEVKRRALAPASGLPASSGASAEDRAQSRPDAASAPAASREQARAPVTQAPAPAAKSLAPEARAASGMRSFASAPTDEVAAAGGTVVDGRGAPVAGARVTVVNDLARSSRSGPDGRFTLPRLAVGDTLSVLRVGFEPARVVVTDTGPVAVRLDPVGPLAPEDPLRPKPGAPSLLGGNASRGLVVPNTAVEGEVVAPGPDVYAGAPADVRRAVQRARESLANARRTRSASGLDEAVVQWERIAASVAGAAEWDARFQALAARREALSLAPNETRLAFFRARLTAFLATAPDSLPERATAQRWQSDFQGGTKALYR